MRKRAIGFAVAAAAENVVLLIFVDRILDAQDYRLPRRTFYAAQAAISSSQHCSRKHIVSLLCADRGLLPARAAWTTLSKDSEMMSAKRSMKSGGVASVGRGYTEHRRKENAMKKARIKHCAKSKNRQKAKAKQDHHNNIMALCHRRS